MADRTVSVKLKADVSEYTAGLVKAAAQTRGLAADVEKSVDRDLPPVMRRSGEKSGGLLAQGFRTGFVRNSPVIAAAIGAALAAGAPVALAGAGVLFGGIGALAAAQTAGVRASWTQLGRGIRDDAIRDASVLVPIYEDMADKIGESFQRMRPEIRDAFEAAAPQIDHFTDSLTQAAENALPGLVRAVERGGPVIEGLGSLMESIGTGISGLFDAMSDDNADAAGQALTEIGNALEEALPLLGELLGTGAELATDVLPLLTGSLGLLLDVARLLGPALPMISAGLLSFKVAQMASGWMGSLGDKLTDFSVRGGIAATTAGRVGGTLTALGQAAPFVGTAAGLIGYSFARSAEELDKFSTAAESAFSRLHAGGPVATQAAQELEALRSVSERVGNSFGTFGSALPDRLRDAARAARRTEGAMTPLDKRTRDVAAATDSLEMAVGKYGPKSEEARAASEGLSTAQAKLTSEQAAVDQATGGATTAIQNQYAALTEVAGVATSASGAIAFLGSTANMSEEDIKAAAQAVVDWRAEVATISSSFVEPLTTYQTLLEAKSAAERKAAQSVADNTVASSDSWRDYVDTTKVTLDDLAVKLQEQITNQENWRENIVTIARRGGADVAQAFLDMGVQGADLTAQMADATDAEFQRMADLMNRDAQFAGSQAVGTFDAQMKIMAAVAASGGQATVQGLAAQLGIGVGQVAAIVQQYNSTLAGGINPILLSLGKPTIAGYHVAGINGPGGTQVKNAWTGGYMGDGGMYEPKGIVHGGEFVFTKKQTAKAGVGSLYDYAKSLDGYASGGFVSSGSVPRPRSTAPYGVPISTAGDATMQKGFDEVRAWVDANAFSDPGGPAGAGVQRWLPLVLASLNLVGQPGGLAQTVLRRMQQESGGNPRAINLGDSNAKKGTPSKGLMQVIDPTFRAYAMPGHNSDIWDPLSNVLASERYAMARYGSLSAAYNRAGGYANGGATPVGDPFWVGESGPELMWSSREKYVTSAATSREFSGGGGGAGGSGSVIVNIKGAEIVGTIDLGDGLTGKLEGVVVSALTTLTNQSRFNS